MDTGILSDPICTLLGPECDTTESAKSGAGGTEEVEVGTCLDSRTTLLGPEGDVTESAKAGDGDTEELDTDACSGPITTLLGTEVDATESGFAGIGATIETDTGTSCVPRTTLLSAGGKGTAVGEAALGLWETSIVVVETETEPAVILPETIPPCVPMDGVDSVPGDETDTGTACKTVVCLLPRRLGAGASSPVSDFRPRPLPLPLPRPNEGGGGATTEAGMSGGREDGTEL